MRIANVDKAFLRRLAIKSVTAEAANARTFEIVVSDGFGATVSGDVSAVPVLEAATAYTLATAPKVLPGDNHVRVDLFLTADGSKITFSVDGVGSLLGRIDEALIGNKFVSALYSPDSTGLLKVKIENTNGAETCAVRISCGGTSTVLLAKWV